MLSRILYSVKCMYNDVTLCNSYDFLFGLVAAFVMCLSLPVLDFSFLVATNPLRVVLFVRCSLSAPIRPFSSTERMLV